MMRRKWFSYLLLLVLSALLSCRREVPEVPCSVIEITLQCDTSPDTKVPVEGIDQLDEFSYLNENKIQYVDFFFYPGGDTGHDATFHRRCTSGRTKSDVFRLDLGSDIVNTYIFPAHDNVDIQTCKVFAVVNYPGTLVNGADYSHTSLPELESIIVQTDFVHPGSRSPIPNLTTHYHPNFMMSGTETMRLNGRSMVLASSATIDLERYACKLTVGVSVADEVAVGNDTWMPMLDAMQVYLVNAVDKVTLGGPLENPQDPNPEIEGDQGDYFDFREYPMDFAVKTQTEEISFLFPKIGDYYNTYPFYMYPQHWVHSSTKAPTKEPFLKLVIPWVRVLYDQNGEVVPQNQKQYYYKIVIPDDIREQTATVNPSDYLCHFVRNNWYHINIDVSILGSETDEASVEADGSVFVVYWQDKNVVVKNAEIGKARYLSVDKDEYEIHNLPTLDIPYTSSHPVAVLPGSIRATRAFFGDHPKDGDGHPLDLTLPETDPNVVRGPGGKGFLRIAGANDSHGYEAGSLYLDFSTEAADEISGWISLDEEHSDIVFTHQIDNRYKEKTFDYSHYTVTFTMVHADQVAAQSPDFLTSIKIIQNPGISIKVWENSDVNNHHNGYVMIDGAQYKRTTSYDVVSKWYVDNKGYTRDYSKNDPALSTSRIIPELQDLQWRVINYTGGSKKMFRIDVSVLPEDSDFVIGDPRFTTEDNLEDENSFLHKTRFHGTPAADNVVPSAVYPEVPPEDSPFWNTWSASAWNSVAGKFSSNSTAPEASVPYSWPEEHNSAWCRARSLDGITKNEDGSVTHHFGDMRTLEHYYPADSSALTANLMAPGYLIASKFGGVEYYNGTPYDEAVYRCAAYQEDGYPAGRWRLPTRGEIRFIAMLSANDAFTFLFSKNNKYWSANGAVLVTSNDVQDLKNEPYALGRCVYDIWYWGEDDQLPVAQRTEFIWGDRER